MMDDDDDDDDEDDDDDDGVTVRDWRPGKTIVGNSRRVHHFALKCHLLFMLIVI